jgi:hypothetical protein
MFLRLRAVHLEVGRYPLEGKPVTHLLLYEVSAVREALLAQSLPRRAGDLGAARPCAAANPAIALQLQFVRPVGQVAELGSLGAKKGRPTDEASHRTIGCVSAR